MNINNSITVIC